MSLTALIVGYNLADREVSSRSRQAAGLYPRQSGERFTIKRLMTLLKLIKHTYCRKNAHLLIGFAVITTAFNTFLMPWSLILSLIGWLLLVPSAVWLIDSR